MKDVCLISENQLLKMRASDAADFCGYSSVSEFNFDFKLYYGKTFKQAQVEARKKYVRESVGRLSDEEIAETFNCSVSSVRQMRIVLGIDKKKRAFGSEWVPDEFIEMNSYDKQEKVQITARLKHPNLPLPKRYRIIIDQCDLCHLKFKIKSGKRIYVTGELRNPAYLYNSKEEIRKFIERIRHEISR